MRTLYIALSVLSLVGAIVGGVHYGPLAGERETAFQQSIEELQRRHEEVLRLGASKEPEARAAFEEASRLLAEEEASLRVSAKLVAQSKGAFGGCVGGGIILAGVFAYLAKQRRAGASGSPPAST